MCSALQNRCWSMKCFSVVFHSFVRTQHAILRLMEQRPSMCWLLHVQLGEPPADSYIDVCVRELIQENPRVVSAQSCSRLAASENSCQLVQKMQQVCACVYLRQGQAQCERPHQQQMRLDPHHCFVRTAYWVDGLDCLQVVLGLNPKAAHSVDHCLYTRLKSQRQRVRKQECPRDSLSLFFSNH